MDIKTLFPAGEWNTANTHFSVRHEGYWCAVAERSGDEVVLTALGKTLSPEAPADPEATAPPILTKPSFRRGRRQ